MADSIIHPEVWRDLAEELTWFDKLRLFLTTGWMFPPESFSIERNMIWAIHRDTYTMKNSHRKSRLLHALKRIREYERQQPLKGCGE